MSARAGVAALAAGVAVLAAVAGCKQPDPNAAHQLGAAAASPATGEERVVEARVVAARNDQLTVAGGDGGTMRLRMDRNTDVLIDGRKGDRDEIAEGARVRAAYQGNGDAPLAVRVEVTSPGRGTPAAAASSDSPLSGGGSGRGR
jgi:hypothetical protein